MDKTEYIDRINSLIGEWKENISDILENGEESEISMLVEETRAVYAFIRVEAQRTVNRRRLSSVKLDAALNPIQSPIKRETKGKPRKKAATPQTKKERVTANAAKLGVDLEAVMKRMAEKG